MTLEHIVGFMPNVCPIAPARAADDLLGPATGDKRGARLGGRQTSSGIKAGAWIRLAARRCSYTSPTESRSFWGDGPVDRRVDGPAMREIGDMQGATPSRPTDLSRHESGAADRSRADRLRAPADAEKQGRQADQRRHPTPGNTESLAAGENQVRPAGSDSPTFMPTRCFCDRDGVTRAESRL
jgi:hypothetical protein